METCQLNKLKFAKDVLGAAYRKFLEEMVTLMTLQEGEKSAGCCGCSLPAMWTPDSGKRI